MENSILSLDVGGRRIGLALAGQTAKLASPLGAIDRQAEDTWEALHKVLDTHNVNQVVIGLPRGLDGQETAQTAIIREFAEEFKEHFDHPIQFQDEAVTSRQAEEELRERGVSYNKADVDALAATYILTDYLNVH